MNVNRVYILTVKAGADVGRRIECTSTAVLGRLEGDIIIDDVEVSRRHATIRVVDGALTVEDLGSRNGTKVNGSRIGGPTGISVGDVIEVGDTQLELESVSIAAAALPRPAATASPPLGAASEPVAQEGADAIGASFGATAASRRSIASRRLTPTLLSFGTIVATAVALLLYFANAR